MEGNILKVLRKDYGYSGEFVPTQMEFLYLNKVFRVGDDYFVKLTKSGDLQPDTHYSAKQFLVRSMSQNGLKVPEVVQTVDGRNYVKVDDYNLEVHRWIPDAEQFGGHNGQIQSAAKAMARFHSFLDDVQDPRIEVVKSLSGPFKEMTKRGDKPFLDELRDYETALISIPSPLRGHLARAIPIMRERYQERQGLDQTNSLDVGIIHADLHDLQMLFSKESKELRAFIDWESARNDPRAFDIGYTLDRLSTDTTVLYGDVSVPCSELSHDPEKVALFLDHYLEERYFSEKNQEAIVDQLVLECLNRNAKWLRTVFSPNISDEERQKHHIYFKIMSIERIVRLEEHIQRGN
jgi:Ser/Thr protein kinase RdoA (MazF antagonist)